MSGVGVGYLGELQLADIVGLPVVLGGTNAGVDRRCVSNIRELDEDMTINGRKVLAAVSMSAAQLLVLQMNNWVSSRATQGLARVYIQPAMHPPQTQTADQMRQV